MHWDKLTLAEKHDQVAAYYRDLAAVAHSDITRRRFLEHAARSAAYAAEEHATQPTPTL